MLGGGGGIKISCFTLGPHLLAILVGESILNIRGGRQTLWYICEVGHNQRRVQIYVVYVKEFEAIFI
jgi:hypothetical protein